MKKILALILAVIMIASPAAVFAASGSEIIIDGERATIAPEMGKVVKKNDRNFVPVRFLLEHFNYNVMWSEADNMVFGSGEKGEIFVMQVGSPLLYFKDAQNNEKKITMDVVPFLNEDEDRTYIPIRFIAEAIGYEVGWEESTDTAILKKK